jgi:peptide deformylase
MLAPETEDPMARGFTRRDVITGIGAGGLLGLAPACTPRAELREAERALLFAATRPLPVVQWHRAAPDRGSVLRRRALPARRLGAEALGRLDARLRETLARSGGVGLAAPQVGISRRVVVVQLQRESKPVLTCVDPVVLGVSPEAVDGYEACLSVAGVGGLVRRAQWVELAYFDVAGRRHRVRSTGWEARIFQHELDHLDGVLYLDRLRGPLLPLEEVRRRRRQGRAERTGRERGLLARRGVSPEAWLL